MRQIALLMALLLFILPVTANAATPRLVGIRPGIDFDGKTANCTVSITGDSMKDDIDAVIKLWQGDSCIATWTTSGTGYVFFSKSKTVTRGKEYTLTVDATINGVTQATISYTDRCE